MKTIPLLVLTTSKLRTLIRKYTKEIGSSVKLHSALSIPKYAQKRPYFSRIRKITKISKNKYICQVSYKNYKTKGYTSYGESCFMEEEYHEDDNYDPLRNAHSLFKTINLLIEHDIGTHPIIYPYKLVVKNKNKQISYNIYLSDFITGE